MLHTFHDGSSLAIITAQELIAVPVWKGNRTLDMAHADAIRNAVSDIRCLDSGYRIVNYLEPDATGALVPQAYLIDGQHRAHVLRTSGAPMDFPVVVTIKNVESETEAIDFFNAINTVKAQQWTVDPALIVNQYIAALERTFNTPRTKFIRPATHRPYLSVDRLREALKKLTLDPKGVAAFCDRAKAKNAALVAAAPLSRGGAIGFMLGQDLAWVAE
jgi:hypothetical protein